MRIHRLFIPPLLQISSTGGPPVRAGPDGRAGGRAGRAARSPAQVPRSARIDSRRDEVVASTADGSYPQCAMQFEQRGSLPRP
jgi:hypothetical protein